MGAISGVSPNKSGRRASDDDAVDVSNGESSMASAVVKGISVTTSMCGVASSVASSSPFKITSTSTRSALRSARGKLSARAHLRTHFLTQEEINAETKHCDTVQAELATQETSDHAAWSHTHIFCICYRSWHGVLPCTYKGFEILAVLYSLQARFGNWFVHPTKNKLGRAPKLEVTYHSCSIVTTLWTSPCQ